jgi:RNA polymerase sigma factor (sigma-70 family)
MFRYFARRVGRSAAEDLTATTFAVAHERWMSFDAARPVRPWLYGIASRLARRYWRDERRMLRAYARTGVDPLVDEDTRSIGRLDAVSRRAELAAALAELRGSDREILLLHAWADFSDAEIASAMSLPVGTVKSRLARTRARLRNRFADYGQSITKEAIATEDK